MIPKIIHYTWFSGDEYPEKIRRCIESWRKIMPDWEIRLWDMDAIKGLDYPFLREAIAARKWACAADFVRLWAVVNYGGVYFDSDVLVFKPFDDLLQNKAFIGKEYSWHMTGRMTEVHLSAHCFGAEAHNTFFARCLSYYQNRRFLNIDDPSIPMSLRCHMLTTAPYVYSELSKPFGYDSSALHRDQFCTINDDVTVYPAEYFDPQSPTPKSYCMHLAMGSWREERSKEHTYDLKYKLQWRLWALVKKVLAKFNREIIEIN